MVAVLGVDPGMLKSIAVTEPIKVAPPTKAPKRSMRGSGSQSSVSGIASAIRVNPLRPGKKAKTMARSVPTIGYRIFGHEKTSSRPFQAA
jgi:hypothetical protein